MSTVRSAVRPWDYTQQKRDLNQQELQKPQTAPSRDTGLEQKLREFMRNGEDWERSRTSILGVFVVKLPGQRLKEAKDDRPSEKSKRESRATAPRMDFEGLIGVSISQHLEIWIWWSLLPTGLRSRSGLAP